MAPLPSLVLGFALRIGVCNRSAYKHKGSVLAYKLDKAEKGMVARA